MDKERNNVAYGLAPTSADSQSSDADEAETFLDNSPWARGQRQNRRLATAIWTILGLVAVLLTLAIAGVALEARESRQPTDESQYFLKSSAGRTYPSKVIRTYWDYDDNFLDHNVTLATEFWKGLFPVGDGIIALNDGEVQDLDLIPSARSFHDPTKSIYLVAAFHQLHCLSQLRSLIIKLHKDPLFSISDPAYYHTMHCVDVVRQQILCHADGTLIYKRPQDKYPGDGGLRTCNNFDALTHWTKDHAYESFAGDPQIVPGHPE